MKYMVDHDVREIYFVAPVKLDEMSRMVNEIKRSNPVTDSYYVFILNPQLPQPSKPAPKFKPTIGEA
jgi:hypothetical protein